ncbi:MAG: glycosyltransferase, partial [Alphaproteobacteria bacterium]|nr:glycosyltransferase [Alphaproteobacteria bacterium]
MKILFFVENNHCGGMDSFFANVINHWPHPEDELCLVCNEDHPGLPNIRSATVRRCEFVAHDIPLNWSVADRWLGFLPAPLRRLFRPLLRVGLFPYQLHRLRKLFRELRGDRLLVVNGAYPGGESCRLANIAWQQTGGAPAVHNIHNFAVPPRPLLALYENWIDRRLEASVHAYIGVSRCCAESLRLRPALADSVKIRHVYNGVAAPRDDERAPVDLRARLGIGDAPLCLMLATYEPRKGHTFLFEAFRRVHELFSQAHLVICGDGTEAERAEVERLRARLAPNANIHLLEFIPGGSKLIRQADMLIVASQEWESFGLTVIASAGSWHHNDLFKHYAARAADGGSRLVALQHGGTYGVHDYVPHYHHEKKIAELFLSWGWKSRDCANVRPFVSSKLSRLPARPLGEAGEGILYIGTAEPRYSTYLQTRPHQYSRYLEWQRRFLGALPVARQQELLVRLYPVDFGWNLEKRWREWAPSVRKDPGRSLHESFHAARIVVI